MIKRYDIQTDSEIEVTQEYFDKLESDKAFFHPLRDIRQFHEKFDLAYNGSPRHLPDGLKKFRIYSIGNSIDFLLDSIAF